MPVDSQEDGAIRSLGAATSIAVFCKQIVVGDHSEFAANYIRSRRQWRDIPLAVSMQCRVSLGSDYRCSSSYGVYKPGKAASESSKQPNYLAPLRPSRIAQKIYLYMNNVTITYCDVIRTNERLSGGLGSALFSLHFMVVAGVLIQWSRQMA